MSFSLVPVYAFFSVVHPAVFLFMVFIISLLYSKLLYNIDVDLEV